MVPVASHPLSTTIILPKKNHGKAIVCGWGPKPALNQPLFVSGLLLPCCLLSLACIARDAAAHSVRVGEAKENKNTSSLRGNLRQQMAMHIHLPCVIAVIVITAMPCHCEASRRVDEVCDLNINKSESKEETPPQWAKVHLRSIIAARYGHRGPPNGREVKKLAGMMV